MIEREEATMEKSPELQLMRCMLEVNQQLIDKVKAKMKKKKEEDRMMQRHGETPEEEEAEEQRQSD